MWKMASFRQRELGAPSRRSRSHIEKSADRSSCQGQTLPKLSRPRLSLHYIEQPRGVRLTSRWNWLNRSRWLNLQEKSSKQESVMKNTSEHEAFSSLSVLLAKSGATELPETEVFDR